MLRRTFSIVLAGLVALLGAAPAKAQIEYSDEMDEYTIPEGTEFKLQLHTTIHSKTSRVGDRVLASLIDAVVVEDREVIPKGMRVEGHIGEAREAGRKGKGGYLYVQFDTVELPSGEKVAIVGSLTEIFSADDDNSFVGVEGELRGRGASRIKQLTIAGGSTAAGAAAGVGPGIAAGVGGLILALVLPRGKQASLSAGSLIGMRLDRDVTIAVPAEEY